MACTKHGWFVLYSVNTSLPILEKTKGLTNSKTYKFPDICKLCGLSKESLIECAAFPQLYSTPLGVDLLKVGHEKGCTLLQLSYCRLYGHKAFKGLDCGGLLQH